MNPVKIILGLIPFALFAVLSTVLPVGWAALLGAVAAIIVIATDLRRGVKIVPVIAVAVLVVFALIGFLAAPALQQLLASYGRGLATLVLAAYILVTAGFAPFTAAYAREVVPREYWGSAKFVSENRRISVAWGLTVLVMAVGHLAAEGLAVAGLAQAPLPFILNWGLPVLAIIATVKYTKRTIATQPQTA